MTLFHVSRAGGRPERSVGAESRPLRRNYHSIKIKKIAPVLITLKFDKIRAAVLLMKNLKTSNSTRMKPSSKQKSYWLISGLLFLSGCATLFGWDIHAPAVLSQRFYDHVQSAPQRLGLYLDPSFFNLISTNKGGRFADPQTYHIGEAYVPILIEGFQQGFTEFVLLEDEPTQEILTRYAIPYLIYIRPKAFENDVTMKGQAVAFETETLVFGPDLQLLDRFRTSGKSDAKKVFAKKGGPQVNLNAALENNAESIILHAQDAIRTGRWQKSAP